jgi:hypothetical protein
VTIHIGLLLLVSEHITGKILADALCLTIQSSCHDSWVKALVTASIDKEPLILLGACKWFPNAEEMQRHVVGTGRSCGRTRSPLPIHVALTLSFSRPSFTSTG